MAIEKTLNLIKPDGVKKGLIGKVLARFEREGLAIRALKMVRLTKEQAEGFYQVHRDKPFFSSLVVFMTSGPIVAVLLEGEGAIDRVRTLMGATDPAKADTGTIRREFAESIERNIVHGSDSPESAAYEIPFFFHQLEIAGE